MKKIIGSILVLGLVLSSCSKSELQQINPNQPTPAALNTEGGVTSFALGIYEKWLANVPGEGNINIMVVAWAQHSMLGDEVFSPYGNFAFRWTDQVYSVNIHRIVGGDTLVVNPNGVNQQAQLQALNSRTAGERNAFMYEWDVNYYIIGQANLLLSALNNTSLNFSGDAVTKRNTLKAWALWWKGYAYSRIGSFYLGGVINNNSANGQTSSLFVDHNAIIVEANNNLDECAALLSSIPSGSTDFATLMANLTPTVFSAGVKTNDFQNGAISSDMWLRQVYSLEARNFLVNKKVKTMTTSDWATLESLTAKGLQQTDNTFNYALDPNLVHDLNGQFSGLGSLYGYFGDGNQFTFPSERLIQDFKAGDARFTKGFSLLSPTNWTVNIRSRGIQFGTRWDPNSIENGGLYATNNNAGVSNVACTWDENALMTAEAKIRSGSDIEGGLQLIDAVRDAQNAGLAHVAGTGLKQAQAIEELRLERRIGLFMRGVAFYDARRWGVTEPVSSGGGRDGAIVLVPGKYIGSASPQALPCQLDYQYMDYWDVPQNELDFNTPGKGSVPVKN